MDLRFGQYRLMRSERRLVGAGGVVDLSARSFDILAMLLDRPDEVVAKSTILDAVWPGLVVEDNTLQVHVSALRKALGDGMIMTVHGRGYKYTGPRPVAAADGPVAEVSGHAGEGQLRSMLDLSGGKTVPVTGGCLCGAVRYLITEPARDTVICHCRMCQRFSGAPLSVASVYGSDAVKFTKGEPKYYKSSPFAERGFCGECGSSLVYRPVSPPVSPNWDGWILIEIGSLDNPVPNVPTWQLGIESQLPWLDLPLGHIRVRCQDSPDIVEAWAAFDLPVP